MRLRDIAETLHCHILCGDEYTGREVDTCCSSDLMEDVMSFSRPGTLLCTGRLDHKVVRTAVLCELGGILLVRGCKPDSAAVLEADSENIPVLVTGLGMFDANGMLYGLGLRGSYWPKGRI